MNRARSQGLVWPCRQRGVNRVARLSRIVGALANLGHRLSNQTGQRPPSPWYFPGAEANAIGLIEELIHSHRDVLVGMDFFTTEVLTLRVDDLLCAVLHPLGDSPGEPGRIHRTRIRRGWSSRRET